VPVGLSLADARTDLEGAVADATDEHGPPAQIVWSGGGFAPGQTALDDPWVRLVRDAASAELAAPPPLTGVGYGCGCGCGCGCDMRLFCARGIPCVLFGPSGIELAHAADERVAIADLKAVARVIVRCIVAFAAADRWL
jgi:acetylornithine deacetylase